MAQATSPSLSISSLESALENANEQLKKASTERVLAQEIENQWHTEVISLKNLIDVRRKRLHLYSDEVPNHDHRAEQESAVDAEATKDEFDFIFSAPAISHVEWISLQVAASGVNGISPPEILKLAEEQERKMHKNYPYIVLRKLVEEGKVIKKAGRYFKKG